MRADGSVDDDDDVMFLMVLTMTFVLLMTKMEDKDAEADCDHDDDLDDGNVDDGDAADTSARWRLHGQVDSTCQGSFSFEEFAEYAIDNNTKYQVSERHVLFQTDAHPADSCVCCGQESQDDDSE